MLKEEPPSSASSSKSSQSGGEPFKETSKGRMAKITHKISPKTEND